ncbi:shugoshin [Drosophila nasuta]|uniref:shugoshin n=1 Tax=Drosophila nasuta TaxID=42062 RepID=UPI00295E94D5|nr:shugoshin [Drosophila nasuta]
MEQYKLINAQLIHQVQTQRLLIHQLQEAEILLKRKLMEAHEERLAEAQYNENKLKMAIKNLYESLSLNAVDNIHFSINRSQKSQSQSQPQSPENGRSTKSSRLCSEFRRSSILLERSAPKSPRRSRPSSKTLIEAKSPCVTSPVDVVRTKTPEPRRVAEILSPITPIEDRPEVEEEEQPDLAPPVIEAGLISIIEENEYEDTTLSSTSETDESEHIVVNDTLEESSLPLRDVTNTTARKPLGSPSSSNQNVESTKHTSGAVPKNKLPICDNSETSIDLVRLEGYQSSPTHLTVRSVYIDSQTPRRSQLSFSTFKPNVSKNGGCSTPVLEQQKACGSVAPAPKSKPKKKPSEQNSGELQSSCELTVSGRPSRSCRPKSLKEPNLMSKMRNEKASKKFK